MIYTSLIISDTESLIDLLAICMVYVGQMTIQVICLFVNLFVCLFLLLSCINSLYILDSNPL